MRLATTATLVQFVALAFHSGLAHPLPIDQSAGSSAAGTLHRRSPLGGVATGLLEAENAVKGAATLGKSASTIGKEATQLERAGSTVGKGGGEIGSAGKVGDDLVGDAGKLGKKKTSFGKKLVYAGVGAGLLAGGTTYMLKSQAAEQKALATQNAALAHQNDEYNKMMKQAGLIKKDMNKSVDELYAREESEEVAEPNDQHIETLERREPMLGSAARGFGSLLKLGKSGKTIATDVKGVEGLASTAGKVGKAGKWAKAAKIAGTVGVVGGGSVLLANELVKQKSQTAALANQNTSLQNEALEYKEYMAELQDAAAAATPAVPAPEPTTPTTPAKPAKQ
ncbi:hypothetical protein CBOM_03966 [Ceraceosorus bombacis]|uniref:Uncharacterized protein n=1 Tax=Ceraceosorus bombacis TaxID=401625 RepID=A0A0P1BMK7_9BASI|nr:hypothetical protein CBOM_03966 [Ceraceosorus bombacis]